MPRSSLAFIFAALLVTACGPHKPESKAPELTKVFVGSSNFRVGETTYASTPDLVAALRSVPKLEAIYIIPDQGVSTERVSDTIASIRAAGIATPIGMVGNEVF